MSDSPRALELAGTIKKIVAGALETEIKDPRLGFRHGDRRSRHWRPHRPRVSRPCSAGRRSVRDCGRARLRQGLADGRRWFAARHSPHAVTRILPRRASGDRSHLDKALHEAAVRDAELAKLRENAQYAGDADPYKHAHEDD